MRRLVARVARRWVDRLAGDPCFEGSLSYAWIDPHGQIHRMSNHERWANEYIQRHFPDRYDEEVDELREHTNWPASRFLMLEGWVRAANAFVFQVYTATSIPERLWHVVVDQVIGCMHGKDPEKTFVFLGEIFDETRYVVADFVHRFGTREQEARLYSVV